VVKFETMLPQFGAEAGGVCDPINEQHTLEMVHLVLNATSQ
jgi:hypothetical protein